VRGVFDSKIQLETFSLYYNLSFSGREKPECCVEYLRRNGLVIVICALLLAAGIFLFASLPPSSRVEFPEIKQNNSKPSNQEAETVPDPAELEKLASLGYTNWSQTEADVRKLGVVHFDPKKAFDGLNLYNSRNLSRANLIDMRGNVVHSWTVPKGSNHSWHTIKIMTGGGLLAIVKDQKLIRLAKNSAVLWEYEAGVHHDVALSPDGKIYVPTRRTEIWTTKGVRLPIVKEFITVLTSDGTFVKEINLFNALSPYLSEEQILKIQSWAQTEDVPDRLKKKVGKHASWWEHKEPDVFHVNSIELIPGEIPGVARKGDILLSVRELDLVCIFRESTGQFVWSWGPGEIQCQHHPTMLENGNILLFDNGCQRGYSRVIELDPRQKRIVWEYKRPKEFFSRRRGGVQRFPNGNTFITESDRGRVFEVSPEGKIVWEFLNPDVSKKKRRAIIYRMVRVPDSVVTQKFEP
jgi:hypothetical protein